MFSEVLSKCSDVFDPLNVMSHKKRFADPFE